jgi:hypothetical protein
VAGRSRDRPQNLRPDPRADLSDDPRLSLASLIWRRVPRQVTQQVRERLVLLVPWVEPDRMVGDERTGPVPQHPTPPGRVRELLDLQPQSRHL